MPNPSAVLLSLTNIRSGQTCTLSVVQCAEYDRLQRELLGVLEVLCKLAAAQPEAFSAGMREHVPSFSLRPVSTRVSDRT